MAGIMYGAFQKYYSALLNLQKFDKEKDFFNNISSLDNFFSEFRNITFVLQKSIAHTQHKNLYEKYKIDYLSGCRWFIEKRNQTVKEEPFPLIKQIDIMVYFSNASIRIDSQRFSVENDILMTDLISQLEDFFSKLDSVQIFFSAKFSFYEISSNDDIFIKIEDGLESMHNFLLKMYDEINDKCSLCDKLIQKSKELRDLFIADDFYFVNDYVYYPKIKQFEKSQKITMVIGNKPLLKAPLTVFDEMYVPNSDKDYFKKFVFLHAIQQNTELMPTVMTVYNDETFTLESFSADIKTIFYRKLYETAQRIIKEGIKEIYFMVVYTCVNSKYLEIPSVERTPYLENEYLTFMKVDHDLNEEEYVFDGKLLNDIHYVANNILYGKKCNLEFGKNNMQPIIEAFLTKKKKG